ncbi:tRNA dihydrouridine synthase [Patescibacteria group bacterium]
MTKRVFGNKPILALAPMAGITDSAFRQICRELGADVVYSEMICVDALYYDSKKTMKMLAISKKEHPVVVQLFGKRPELFGKAAKIVEKAGADGIDINFGCPAKKVVRHNGGVALMRDFKLSREIVQAVTDVVDIPVSVKIRAGIRGKERIPLTPLKKGGTKEINSAGAPLCACSPNWREGGQPASLKQQRGEGDSLGQITAIDFVKNILDLPISAIMIHGRTYEQGFSGEPDYEMIKNVVELVRGKIVVLANGGIKSAEDAKKMFDLTGADGIGIAQGVLGKPWLFAEIERIYTDKKRIDTDSKDDIKKIALRHAKFAYEMKGDHGIIEMRKHLLWYVKGWENAKELRAKLVKVQSVDDIEDVFKSCHPALDAGSKFLDPASLD